MGTVINRIVNHLTGQVQHPLSTLIFSRCLTLLVLLKFLWQWPVNLMVLHVHHFKLYAHKWWGYLFWPVTYANEHPYVFFSCVVLFLVVHLVVRRNFLTSWIFCAVALNLLLLNRPSGDGGDLVTLALSFWALFMVPPATEGAGLRAAIEIAICNLARIGCLLQFVFLYAASGIDKIKSSVWTSGHAFDYMRYAGAIINPRFPQFFATPFWDITFTWSTIVLEIVFGVLVWFRSWQPVMIWSAIVFHLGIWWMLDLADFALVMIVSVLLFIRDDQYLSLFRPSLLSA